MLPDLATRRRAPYEVREVEVDAETAERLPIYGPYYQVFDRNGVSVTATPLTWSDATREAARMNEA